MKCPACGTENLDGVNFCAGCGGDLSAMQQAANQNVMVSSEVIQPQYGTMVQPSYEGTAYNNGAYNNGQQMYGTNPQGIYNNEMQYYGNGQPMVPSEGGKGLAIAGMVCGIVGLTLVCIPWLGLICSLTGIILSSVALSKKSSGKGMAIAGLVCGSIGILAYLIVILMACTTGYASFRSIFR